jgi:hypothetical protein
MPKERGRDHERIEVGGALDRPAVVQQESVNDGPLDDFACALGAKPKFNEQQAAVATPLVDVSAQIRQADPDASEFCLCRLYPDHRGCQWLRQHNIWVQ